MTNAHISFDVFNDVYLSKTSSLITGALTRTTTPVNVLSGGEKIIPQYRDYYVRVSNQSATEDTQMLAFAIEAKVVHAGLESVFNSLVRDVLTLRDLSAWFKRRLDYQGLFNSFNFGTISEEEFEELSADYAEEFKFRNALDIRKQATNLRRLVTFDISDEEIADYLDVHPDDVTRALSSVPKDELTPYLMGLGKD